MWTAIGIGVAVILVLLIEYRYRRPDQILLHEVRGTIKRYRRRFYPRHFCLSIPAKLKSMTLEVEAEAKGKLGAIIRLSVTVSPSPDHLPELVRAGGWDRNAVSVASQELEVEINALVREFVEKHEIDDITGDMLSGYLREKMGKSYSRLGLDVLSINVQAIDATDTSITESIRKREAARIREETEAINQKARLAATRVKNETDQKVARYDHALEIQKLTLQEKEEEREAALAEYRTREELKRRELQLDVDRKEMELLRQNPELLLLTPQIARLAEASQALRNAKTVVSLSPEDFSEKGPVARLLQKFLSDVSGKPEDSPPEKRQSR